jgi:hypothetical protein
VNAPANQTNQKSPATVFLRLAGFNALVSVVFTVFYFLYESSGGDRSYYLLLAAGAGLIAALGALFAYRYFKAKLEGRGIQ